MAKPKTPRASAKRMTGARNVERRARILEQYRARVRYLESELSALVNERVSLIRSNKTLFDEAERHNNKALALARELDDVRNHNRTLANATIGAEGEYTLALRVSTLAGSITTLADRVQLLEQQRVSEEQALTKQLERVQKLWEAVGALTNDVRRAFDAIHDIDVKASR